MKPQGGSGQLPVTGSLAHTGSSSSALAVVGLVGGAAAVGAMFVVRRRKGIGANPAV